MSESPTLSPPFKRTWLSDHLMLLRPRLLVMVAVVTGAGYAFGAPGDLHLGTLVAVLCGIALVGGGSSALNQVLEIELDARMERTAQRPLPEQRLTRLEATLSGSAMLFGGLVILWQGCGPLPGSLGLISAVTYLGLYTPLKTRSSLNTLAGGIPGALPVLIGYSAATGHLDGRAGVLFAILFLWQLPHFLAIAWLYREQYAAAGHRMLPYADPHGERTSRQVLVQSAGMLPVTLLPTGMGLAGMVYLAGAGLVAVLYLAAGTRFARTRTRDDARILLKTSLLYLPVVYVLMVLDRVG
ncbi:MAG: protoheme IX farnesyltransferase [Planctomycetes bacterium]|nr:protoheme IX farnesyltransferase [Planctomycetota bacterium]